MNNSLLTPDEATELSIFQRTYPSLQSYALAVTAALSRTLTLEEAKAVETAYYLLASVPTALGEIERLEAKAAKSKVHRAVPAGEVMATPDFYHGNQRRS